MISFVIYYHSSRLDNLNQTLRFLRKRENLDAELILVCQDQYELQEDTGFKTYQYNMNMSFYHKAKMCNFGVGKASYDVVALIDSDRILPEGYFSRCLTDIKPRDFISTEALYRLKKEYSDEEIENDENLEKYQDFRSLDNTLFRKNLFAGNTVMFKEDYFKTGGMDESYAGYGFTDTDMTQNILSKGYKAKYLKEKELHLCHSHNIIWDNQKFYDFKIISFTNAIKYCLKWKKINDVMLLKEKMDNENFEHCSLKLSSKYNEEKLKIDRLIKWF
jgi:hypothetical protein